MSAVHNTFVFSSLQVRQAAQESLYSMFPNLDILYRKRFVSVVQYISSYFGIRRSVVYLSFEGQGSRRVRLFIAHLIGSKPSDIWFNIPEDRVVLDDYYYFYGDKPVITKDFLFRESKNDV